MRDLYNPNVPVDAKILCTTPFQNNTAILTIYQLPDGSYWRVTNWVQDEPQPISAGEAMDWARRSA